MHGLRRLAHEAGDRTYGLSGLRGPEANEAAAARKRVGVLFSGGNVDIERFCNRRPHPGASSLTNWIEPASPFCSIPSKETENAWAFKEPDTSMRPAAQPWNVRRARMPPRLNAGGPTTRRKKPSPGPHGRDYEHEDEHVHEKHPFRNRL
jgi:hypothetical protein